MDSGNSVVALILRPLVDRSTPLDSLIVEYAAALLLYFLFFAKYKNEWVKLETSLNSIR